MDRIINLVNRFYEYFKRPDRLFEFITLTTVIILGIRSATSGQPDDYFESILVVLSLLAIANLLANYSSFQRDQKLDNLSDALKQIQGGPVPAHRLFKTRDEWEPLPGRLSRTANTLDMIGNSLNSIAVTHQAVIQKLLDRGVKMRFIITNPENTTLGEEISNRTYEIKSSAQHKTIGLSSLQNFLSLTENTQESMLQVRITDSIPSFSYVGIDTDTAHGQIFIELYLKKIPLNRNPMWSMYCDSDAHWVNEFKQQFEKMWESSTPAVKPHHD